MTPRIDIEVHQRAAAPEEAFSVRYRSDGSMKLSFHTKDVFLYPRGVDLRDLAAAIAGAVGLRCEADPDWRPPVHPESRRLNGTQNVRVD